MDLKIITNKQVLEVVYEGRLRRFTVSSMAAGAATDPVDAITKGLGDISIQSTPRLGYISWDTAVSIGPADPPEHAAPVSIPSVRYLS